MPRSTKQAAVATTVALVAAAPVGAAPIANPGPTSLPHVTGAPATPDPVPAPRVPRNPFMAPNPNNNIHNDTWITNAYTDRSGPLGRHLVAESRAMPLGLCGSLTFDAHGRLIGVCPSFSHPVTARVLDPKTLEILSSYVMPGGPNTPGPQAFQNFTGGGYFYLDGKDRIWSATKTSYLLVLAERDAGDRLVKVADYDLSRALGPGEHVTSALPDFQGRVWFVSKRGGVVGILDTETRKIRSIRLGEEIENSFSVDRDGVYIVSDKRLYGFGLHGGCPRIVWSVTYRNTGVRKPGQVDAGSGTTPTLMNGGYVAIADNADPMDVVVYRRAVSLPRGVSRTVCTVPVFEKGASATENSLTAAARSLFVENNYGYQDPFGPSAGALTAPGLARVDVRTDGRGCRLVWTNRDVRAPTVLPKLSTKTGLIYAYEQSGPQCLVLERDRRAYRFDAVAALRRQWIALQQQLRGGCTCARRIRISRCGRRDRPPARRSVLPPKGQKGRTK